METPPQLIIRFDEQTNATMAKFIPIMIIAMSIFLFIIMQEPKSLSHVPWLTTLMRWFLIFGIAFFIGIGILAFIMTSNKKPLAILDKNGIWMRYYNHVPWENIEEISLYTISGAPLRAVGIRVKDVDQAARNSNASGRFGLWCVKTCRQRYHMNLTNTNGALEDITLFVHRHVIPQHPTIICNLTTISTSDIDKEKNDASATDVTTLPAKKPNIFTRTDFFITPFMLIFFLLINRPSTTTFGFSSRLGFISSFVLAALLGVLLRQFWGPLGRQFKEKKLVPLSEIMTWGTVVTGIFIADKIMTGTFYYSLIINLSLGLVAWAEVFRRQYWTR